MKGSHARKWSRSLKKKRPGKARAASHDMNGIVSKRHVHLLDYSFHHERNTKLRRYAPYIDSRPIARGCSAH